MFFFNFGIKDFIDIMLVAFLLYYIYKLMKDSGSINIFFGILVFIVLKVVVVQVLDMELLGTIFDSLASVGVFAIIVLFQEEIRRFLLTFGSRRRSGAIMRMLFGRKEKDRNACIMPIVMACMSMSKDKTGALIIVERNIPLTDIIATGTSIDAIVSQPLLENIFFKNTPLHDGAVIVSGNRLKAAGCILPVSHSRDIPKKYGLRHRSALGIASESDAIAIIVSEETGHISIAHRGVLNPQMTPEGLEEYLIKNIAPS
ncbi:MAG: diadenylate cyclase CdaA [Bacteroidaceae bacterium]|nr:diadenylate cyclase CdaA [Bacteroidaceae bacterium]